ncbi:hypothetical protein NRB16_26940, partial [Pseudomonas sp. LJDD11]|nr:hypothetical protein [Pseudomonas sp. LJDD11]
KKAKARVQRIHSRIGNARRDYLHNSFSTNFPGLALYYPSRQQVLPKLRAFNDHVLAGRS